GCTEAAVDSGIVVGGDVGNSVRLEKRDQLATADIEEHVPEVTAFFDGDCVGDNRLEAQYALVNAWVLSRSRVERPICEKPLWVMVSLLGLQWRDRAGPLGGGLD